MKNEDITCRAIFGFFLTLFVSFSIWWVFVVCSRNLAKLRKFRYTGVGCFVANRFGKKSGHKTSYHCNCFINISFWLYFSGFCVYLTEGFKSWNKNSSFSINPCAVQVGEFAYSVFNRWIQRPNIQVKNKDTVISRTGTAHRIFESYRARVNFLFLSFLTFLIGQDLWLRDIFKLLDNWSSSYKT